MLKLLQAFVITVVVCNLGLVQAEVTQVALIQQAFGALKQSSAAIDQGDFDKAQKLLAGIKSSAEMLRNNVRHFSQQAAIAADQREAQARDVTTQITNTHQAILAADSEKRKLEAKIADLTTQLNSANATRNNLNKQAEIYAEETQFRRQCNERFAYGIFWSTRCTELGFQDLFNERWLNLNNQIDANNKQRIQIEISRGDLYEHLDAQQLSLYGTMTRKDQLEVQLQQLDQQAKTLRAAVVSLSDAAMFWTDTLTLIDSKISSIDTLQVSLKLLARRASEVSSAPVFDTYNKEVVRSLEATLVDFARTLDNGTNILLKP